MTLRIVPAEPDKPLSFEEANSEFQQHWTAARKAYADLLTAVGGPAHPLYIQKDRVTRARIEVALHDAERVAKHAQALMAEMAACREIWERAARAEQGPTKPTAAPVPQKPLKGHERRELKADHLAGEHVIPDATCPDCQHYPTPVDDRMRRAAGEREDS